jgi:tetratricopeptide (TPR) repeat protein
MKRILKSLLLLVSYIVLPFVVNAKYEFLLNRTYTDRFKDIDSCFYYNTKLRTDKPAFFKEISKLADEASLAGDIELVAEAKLLIIAFNSASKQGEFSKVEDEAGSLLNFSQQHKLVQIEIRCRQFLGRFYMEKVGRYIESIDEFLSSYYLMQKLSVNEFPTKKEHLYEVAHAYYNFGDFASAKKYMMEAQNTPMPHNLRMQDDKHKIRTYISLENTLGLLYRNEQKYDSAIYYFGQVYDLAAAQQDSVWMGIALGNVGIC